MPRKDIIVVGASAGGVEVLKTLTERLPADLEAAVLVVLHLAPSSPSVLPSLLQRRSALPVAFAVDGEPLEAGRVYVAPPDRHLVVEPGLVRVTRAPRENRARPAIDPLFRSAALAYGSRVVGVILSGRLDDGTAVVQDPADTMHPDMPRNAMQYTTPDHVVTAAQLAPLLARLAAEPAPPPIDRPPSPELEIEVRIAMESNAYQQGSASMGPPSPYTCPDCHGAFVRVNDGGVARFRCHTGHAFSLDSLLSAVTESVEESLWNALRALEESAMLLREAAGGHPSATLPGAERTLDPRFEQSIRAAEAHAEVVRQTVLRHHALSLESIRVSANGGERAPDAVAPSD